MVEGHGCFRHTLNGALEFEQQNHRLWRGHLTCTLRQLLDQPRSEVVRKIRFPVVPVADRHGRVKELLDLEVRGRTEQVRERRGELPEWLEDMFTDLRVAREHADNANQGHALR